MYRPDTSYTRVRRLRVVAGMASLLLLSDVELRQRLQQARDDLKALEFEHNARNNPRACRPYAADVIAFEYSNNRALLHTTQTKAVELLRAEAAPVSARTFKALHEYLTENVEKSISASQRRVIVGYYSWQELLSYEILTRLCSTLQAERVPNPERYVTRALRYVFEPRVRDEDPYPSDHQLNALFSATRPTATQ
jgi:hypothetical protein